jgi:alpha-L-fucosidase
MRRCLASCGPIAPAVIAAVASVIGAELDVRVEPPPVVMPSPEQAAWQDLELGMFIHLAPQTWEDAESDNLSITPAQMNPDKLDTDQWVRVAESMGAGYIVFVAKHEGGFCWWQTETTDFSVKSTPRKGGNGDVLADLSASCRARGMKLGVYISPQDRKHGIGVGGKAKGPDDQASYERLFRQQLTEVLSR